MKESLIAILVLSAVFFTGYGFGHGFGYSSGVGDGISISEGDGRWDCGWSRLTGFVMCNRTSKFKD